MAVEKGQVDPAWLGARRDAVSAVELSPRVSEEDVVDEPGARAVDHGPQIAVFRLPAHRLLVSHQIKLGERNPTAADQQTSTRASVELKVLIEQLREQVQNVE